MSQEPQNSSIAIDDPTRENAIIFRRILIATDFSAISDIAFEYAASIAERYDAQLYVVHVIDSRPFDLSASEPESSVLAQVHEEAHQKIEYILKVRGVPTEQYHIVITPGALPNALIDIMRQHQIDLAILGTHGHKGLKKLLTGSVTEEVFRIAPCAVLNLGPNAWPIVPIPELRHILYPVEVAPDRSEAAKYAVSIAEHYRGKLTIMNVMEDVPASPNRREDFPIPVTSWIDDHIPRGSGLRGRVVFESGSGPAAKAILDFASSASVDLIVLGIHPMDPIIAAHLPNHDTAYEIVSRATCPVLTIR